MQSSGNFFNNFAEKFDTFYDGKRSWLMQWIDHKFRRDMFIRFDMTFDFLGDLTGKRVLDIGCGSGPFIIEALKRGAIQVIGIDPARNMLSLARERVKRLCMMNRVFFLQGYFPEVCLKDKFDFCIALGVMDYIEDTADFLKSLQGLALEKAVISFPSTHWLRTPLRKLRYKIRGCPVYFYDKVKIEKLMQESNLLQYSLISIPGAGMDYVVCINF